MATTNKLVWSITNVAAAITGIIPFLAVILLSAILGSGELPLGQDGMVAMLDRNPDNNLFW